MLLYGSEMWVVSELMWKKLWSFHHGVERHIENKRYMICEETGERMVPYITDILEEFHLNRIDEYVKARKETLTRTVTGEDYVDVIMKKFSHLPTQGEINCGVLNKYV